MMKRSWIERYPKQRLSHKDALVLESHFELMQGSPVKYICFHKRNRKSWWKLGKTDQWFWVQTVRGKLVTNYLHNQKPGTVVVLKGRS